MALIQCVQCGNKVNSRDKNCSQCGFPMNAKQDSAFNEENRISTRNQRKNSNSAQNDEAIIRFLRAQKKMRAAYLYKEQYGYSLQDSIEAVERLAAQNNIRLSNNTSKMRFLLLLAIVVGILMASLFIFVKANK